MLVRNTEGFCKQQQQQQCCRHHHYTTNTNSDNDNVGGDSSSFDGASNGFSTCLEPWYSLPAAAATAPTTPPKTKFLTPTTSDGCGTEGGDRCREGRAAVGSLHQPDPADGRLPVWERLRPDGNHGRCFVGSETVG